MNAMQMLKSMEFLDDDLIMENNFAQNDNGHCLISRPMLIAAIIIAGILLITACASMGGTVNVLQFLSDAAPGKLSSEQVEYIAANTLDVNKSVTVNGYTMTLRSVFSDGRDILLQFDLTAPMGVILDADTYKDRHGTILESEGGMPLGMAMQWQLQDKDRTDNKISLIYSIESAWNREDTVAGQNCHFYIYGLDAVWHEHRMNREEMLTEGCWRYDIHFPENCNQSISFVQEPVRVCQPVTVGYERTGEHTMMPVVEIQEGRIFSLNLWSLGAELSFRFEEASQNAEFGDLYAVMKDGKKILLKTSFKMPDFITYKADTPIILEQVDHLELENGTIFPKP